MSEPKILYRDDSCVVVDKRAGEAVEGAGPSMVDLRAALAELLVPTECLEPAHRLDVPVTGCVVFALDAASLAALNESFASSRVEKIYWAIVERPGANLALPQTGELIHYILFDKRINKSRAYDETGSERKKAIMRYRIVGEGDRYLFLEIELVSGRHHQIRAQLAAMGLHIKGDLKYGARRSEKNGGIRLHCVRLAFPHPLKKGERVNAVAPIPEKDALWEAFEAAATKAPVDASAPRA